MRTDNEENVVVSDKLTADNSNEVKCVTTNEHNNFCIDNNNNTFDVEEGKNNDGAWMTVRYISYLEFSCKIKDLLCNATVVLI